MAEGYLLSENTTVSLPTQVYITTDHQYGKQLEAFRNRNVILVDFAFNSDVDLSSNAQLCKITLPKNLVKSLHLSCITNYGEGIRIVMATDGTISLESNLTNHHWVSGTFVGLI